MSSPAVKATPGSVQRDGHRRRIADPVPVEVESSLGSKSGEHSSDGVATVA